MSTSPRYGTIEAAVKSVIKKLSGRDLSAGDSGATFFDLGFDSLLLTQVSQSLRQTFGVKITFRQLMENLVTISAVSEYLDGQVPPDKFTEQAPAAAPAAAPVQQYAAPSAPAAASVAPVGADGTTFIDRVVKQQLVLMNQQIDLLRAHGRADSSLRKLRASRRLRRARPKPQKNQPLRPSPLRAISGLTSRWIAARAAG